MTILQLFSALLLVGGTWFVWDSLTAREAAVAASRALCASEGLQFLDDTVALISLRPTRDSQGRVRLRRIYGFEYSDTGNNRRNGSVTMMGATVITLYVGPRPVPEGQVLH